MLHSKSLSLTKCISKVGVPALAAGPQLPGGGAWGRGLARGRCLSLLVIAPGVSLPSGCPAPSRAPQRPQLCPARSPDPRLRSVLPSWPLTTALWEPPFFTFWLARGRAEPTDGGQEPLCSPGPAYPPTHPVFRNALRPSFALIQLAPWKLGI